MLRSLKWLLVLILWVYIIARAYSVPITHDEAYSYLLIKTNYIKAMAGTANTHWLNSLGMKIGSLLLGDQPWQLRIFSMLAWILYGFSAITVSGKMRNKLAGLTLLVVLVANPFILDFFSLARGYGLACAFTLASIWKATEAIEKDAWRPKDWLPAIFLASLSVMSNYTTFYFFMSFVLAYIIVVVAHGNWKWLWPPSLNRWWVLVAGTGLIAVSNLMFIKLYTGDLEYGGDSNLFMSVIGSFVRGSFYYITNEKLVFYLTYAIVFLLCICFIYAYYSIGKTKSISSFSFISSVVLSMLLLNIIFHLLFKTPYLFSRTTLVFYPCIIVMLFYGLNEVTAKKALDSYIPTALSLPVLILFVYHFIGSYNLQYCYEWKDQADTKKAFDTVVRNKGKDVLIHKWHAGVFINYYRVAQKDNYPFRAKTFNTDDVTSLTDAFCDTVHQYDHMVLLPPFDLEKMRKKGLKFTILKQFPVTGAVVLHLLKENQNQ
jgi:hypothetical protein